MAKAQPDEVRDRDLNQIKALIKSNLHVADISVLDTPKGLAFKTKYGQILIPNEAIDYYYTVFNETIQKIRKYEGYIDRIDSIIEQKDPEELCNELKEIIDWFNFSEVFRENYSVVSQWLNDESITKEMLGQLYKAYSSNSIAGLDQNLSQKFTQAIKKSLSYYNVLLKMFDIFDAQIFNRKE